MNRLSPAICVAAGAYALGGGCLTLLGWLIDAPRLTAWGGGISMKANTAICAVAGGCALLLLALGALTRAVRALGSLVFLVAAFTLFQHLTGINLGIDTLLFDEPPGAPATVAPGRMGPPASTSFTILGVVVLLATHGARARRVAAAIAIVPIAIAALGTVGYLYGASQLYAVARLTGIALQTATMIAALGIGLIAAIPEYGLSAAISRDDPGGVMFRRLALPVLAFPLAVGWLRTLGEQAGYYDSAFGTAARTLVEVVILLALVWWTAEGVSRHARVALQAEQALRDADRRKDEFLATLAHELRNPLAPLRTALEVLRLKGRDAAAAQRAHATMDRQLAQMVHLVDDLLDVNRISRGTIELREENVDIATVIDNALETTRPVIDGFGHEVVTLRPAHPIRVRGDITRLTQVIGNLLNNAAKYTQAGGRIRIKVERVGGEVLVHIRDNGIGIQPDVLPTIFDLFVRATPSRDRPGGGLGIGLALVRQLVHLHRGRVEVRSPPPDDDGEPPNARGRGSEFTVRLPVVEVEPAAAAAPSTAEARSAPARLRILIADDNVDAAETLAMLLQSMGHEACTAHDGAQALEAAASFHPDVALLDIGMPKLTGYDVCKALRAQQGAEAPVVVAVTGWGQLEERKNSAQAGFDYHLVKPVAFDVLQRILAGVRVGGRRGTAGT